MSLLVCVVCFVVVFCWRGFDCRIFIVFGVFMFVYVFKYVLCSLCVCYVVIRLCVVVVVLWTFGCWLCMVCVRVSLYSVGVSACRVFVLGAVPRCCVIVYV